MKRSEKLDKFAAAFCAAQSEFKHAVKDSVNPHFKSKYADIQSDIEASRPALIKHGISVLQPTSVCEGVLVVNTLLLHTSEQWVSSEYPVRIDGLNPQQIKSAVTYARRTSYEAILSLATSDDDANEVTQPQRRAPAVYNEIPFEGPQETLSVISDKQRKLLYAKFKNSGMDEAEFKQILRSVGGVESTKDLPWVKMDQVLRAIDGYAASASGSETPH